MADIQTGRMTERGGGVFTCQSSKKASMALSEDIEMLIQVGEQLIPKAGSIVSGYNGQLQPDYVAWRLQTMAVIGELGKAGNPLLKDLETDKVVHTSIHPQHPACLAP